MNRVPEVLRGLVNDLPLPELVAFEADLNMLSVGREPTRTDVIALRIAGDPEIFTSQFPAVLTFGVVRQLVERGHLTEANIERYNIAEAS